MSLRVVTIENGGAGQGHDLTDDISGLRWSSVRPGGDETCSFTYHRSWFASVPEIAKGNLVRVMDGVDVLGQFRIEEQDRGGENDEQIAVTAYGLGARLKDDQLRIIYVDSALDHWGPGSTQWKLNRIAASIRKLEDASTTPDNTTGEPSLETGVEAPWVSTDRPESTGWYDAGDGVQIGSVYYAWKTTSTVSAADTNWTWQLFASDDDLLGSVDTTGNLRAAGPSSGTLTTTGGDKRFATVQMNYAAVSITTVDGRRFPIFWTALAVYGDHTLTKQGSGDATTPPGFLASQMIEDAAGRATGITVRRVDATSFVVTQAEFRDGATYEEAITKLNETEAHNRTWATWAPDSPLDTSTNGQFDYVATDPTTQHWFTTRAECDDLDLHTELATLFNAVDVHFSDASGHDQIVTRTAAVPELDEDDITRTARLDAGSMELEIAQALGDAFLALSGNFAPARGSVTISRPIRHHQRGELPPHHMRADGSNLRLPDILPSETLFELDSDPDRRTTFPLKRVEVDASGDQIQVSAEIDQVNDVLSSLQSRLAAAAESVLA